MHNPSTSVTCNEFPQQDLVAAIRTALFLKIVKQRDVLNPFQILSKVLLKDFILLGFLIQSRQSALGEDVDFIICDVLQLEVHELRVDRDGEVGRQCPRSCGPGHEINLRVIHLRE